MSQRVIIDVREPAEYGGAHVEGAINIPPAALIKGASELGSVPKDAEIIVYCVSGSRSNVAKHMLEQMGYTNITNGINQGQVRAKYQL